MPPIVYLVRHGEAEHNIDVSQTLFSFLLIPWTQNSFAYLESRLYSRRNFDRYWQGTMSQFEKHVPIS